MFAKILIANRGEIAVRIIKTARRLGIATVAVYSDADEGALAVELADEAVRVGPPAPRESYLAIDKIVAAARDSGAEAVHPGYGFLAENADFARAVAAAGLVFVGPNPDAIALMGDKIASKACAAEAGVNVVPGHAGEIADAKAAVRAAREIGYPVMIKAAGGGGGKGMRAARTDAEAREGFAAARSEAKTAFGDPRVLIEKLIERPRHIEIQVLGDKHANVVHLGERECSIQRRNQKVIEEAPSPFLDAKTRRAMAEQAVALAKAVGYDSAGTVEFIVDAGADFHFLEMNTRLQVEHPTTELVTGLDLVEVMLRVAAGEPLELAQKDVKPKGWAVEARICTEDPARGFLPSIGRLKRFRPPKERKTAREVVRLDAGVREGDEISLHYDPLIAKLIAWGRDRAAAVETLAGALEVFEIDGVEDNLDFLAAVLAQERFGAGDLTTGFVAEAFPEGFVEAAPGADERSLFLAAAVYAAAFESRRAGAAARRDWAVVLEGETYPVTLELEEEGASLRLPGSRKVSALKTPWRPGERVFRARLDANAFTLRVDRTLEGWRLRRRGVAAELIVASPRAAELRARLPAKPDREHARGITSPMPGLVASVLAAAGQAVKAGEPLLIVEAMKMENVVRAERDGVVKTIHVSPGASVAADALLVEFE